MSTERKAFLALAVLTGMMAFAVWDAVSLGQVEIPALVAAFVGGLVVGFAVSTVGAVVESPGGRTALLVVAVALGASIVALLPDGPQLQGAVACGAFGVVVGAAVRHLVTR